MEIETPRPGRPRDFAGTLGLVLYLLAVSILLLEPFDFHRPAGFEALVPVEFSATWLQRRVLVAELAESLGHGLLFVPLAPLVAWSRRVGYRGMIAPGRLALLVALCCLSELMQVFVTRDVSVIDFTMDLVGLAIGLGALRIYEHSGRLRGLVHSRSVGLPLLLAAGCCVATVLLAFLPAASMWPQVLSLRTWEDHYPLTLGNDRLGTHPWRGKVRGVTVLDRALSPQDVRLLSEADRGPGASEALADSSVVADYPLATADASVDSSGAVVSVRPRVGPALRAVRSQITPLPAGGLEFRGKSILRGFGPQCTALVAAIRRSDEFTVFVSFQPDPSQVSHPAVILSSACCTRHLNFVLSQEGTFCVFRMHSRYAGKVEGGDSLAAPVAFCAPGFTSLAVTYRSGTLRLFLDGKEEKTRRITVFHWLAWRVFESEFTPRVAAGVATVAWIVAFFPFWAVFERRGTPFPRSGLLAAVSSFPLFLVVLAAAL